MDNNITIEYMREVANNLTEVKAGRRSFEIETQIRIDRIKNNEISEPSAKGMIDKLKEITKDYEFIEYTYFLITKEENIKKIINFIDNNKNIEIEEVKRMVDELADEEIRDEEERLSHVNHHKR